MLKHFFSSNLKVCLIIKIKIHKQLTVHKGNRSLDSYQIRHYIVLIKIMLINILNAYHW